MLTDDIPVLTVPNDSLDITSLWRRPGSAPTVQLRESSTGGLPRLRTEVSIYRSDHDLHVIFTMDDDEVVATMVGRDTPLWKEDVVELFLAPHGIDRYFELEVSPLGTIFDARVLFPGPDRATMTVDAGWNCAGLWAATRRTRSQGVHVAEVIVTVPFASLGSVPSAGDTWRANFYRIDRSRKGDSFSAWSPTLASPPDFHIPSRFGSLRF